MTTTDPAHILDTEHVLIGHAERVAVVAALDSRDLSGTAAIVAAYETELATWFATDHAIACSSGTAALHLALLALDVSHGDEVIIAATAPAMTALPVLAVGAIPVFAETASATTFALDLTDPETKVSPRTKAIIAVPMWGYPADPPALVDTCRAWQIPLIEDAAQAHGTTMAGRYAGTTATIGTFSTHTRKLLSTGEGGFCLTNDDALSTRLRELRNLGKPAGRAFGTRFGLNYKLNALSTALGRAQLGRLHDRLRHRRATLNTITDMITNLPGIAPFPVHPDGQANGYAALLTTHGPALPVAERLAAAGVTSDPLRYQYRPLYHSPAFAQFTPAVACRHAEQLCETLVSIPSHEGVGPHDLDRIQAALRG